MQTSVARQPIFDRSLRTFGYELLFRSGASNVFEAEDGDKASSSVISDSFFTIGLPALTGGKPAFINFTREMLVQEYAGLIAHEGLVVELLEDIDPSEAVVEACRNLKQQGYRLALDDFENRPDYGPLIDLADIIKVDFLLTSPAERRALAEEYGNRGIALLAEKVETQDEFDEAKALGYTYFQGYFFSKPVIVEKRAMPESKLVKMQLLQEVNKPVLDVERASELLRHDAALVYKFLRYINSAAFGLRHRIHSVDHAMHMLGERNFRKWVSLVTLANMAEEKPTELLRNAVVRGRFCELLAAPAGLDERGADLFMVGLLSHIDAIMDQPLPKLLEELPVERDVAHALLPEADETPLRPVYEAVIAFETASWQHYDEWEQRLGLASAPVPRLYCQAVAWGNELLDQ